MDIGKIHQQQTYFEDCFKIKLVDIFGKSTFFSNSQWGYTEFFLGATLTPFSSKYMYMLFSMANFSMYKD